MSVRILLTDDHKIVRDGLQSLLEKQHGMEVVATAGNGRMAIRLVEEFKPDIVIMDVTMPDMNGIVATRQIIAESPETKVIALSMHSDRRFVEGMLRAGAKGYLLKDCAFEELTLAIRTVVGDQYFLSPIISDSVIRDYTHSLSINDIPAHSALTAREREVLQLVAEGKSTKQISSHLNVSQKTIETHRRQIMVKLDIHSIAELTKFALREGLTSIES